MNNYENRDNRDRNQSNYSNNTQLFIAKGRNHGMTPESLIHFIASETGTNPTDITNPKVLDDFSFVAVPHADVDAILNHFQAKAGDGRPVVSKAKRKTNNGFGDRDRRSNNDRDRGSFGGGYRNSDRDNRDRRGNNGGGYNGGGNGYNYNRDNRNDNRGNSSNYNNRPRRDDY